MTDDAATILVVEDDDATRAFLADNLTADGYDLLVADSARDGARLLETKFPDLLVLDVGLPDASGLDLLRRLRDADGVASRVDPRTPVLVLSGRAAELDRVRGFERGCDDYVAKPFSYPELRARVGALLARANQRRAMGRLRVGDLEVHPSSRRVLLRGTPIELSQKEFALLRTLATEPTKVWTKEELLRSIWGFRSMGSYRRLRQENRCVVSWRIDHADCLQAMAAMPAGSVDAIVTDPPYGLEFMGKEWDRFGRVRDYKERSGYDNRGILPSYGRGGRSEDVDRFKRRANRAFQQWCELWAREALRVLKPGGHLLAFGGTRTYHRLACAIEDAGLEIRDTLCWLYGSGFPKSLNVGDGWGTALKPAHEPVVVARKPLAGTVAQNVQLHGTGALNIDATRIATDETVQASASKGEPFGPGSYEPGEGRRVSEAAGRWPANVAMDEQAAAMLDEQSGELRSPGSYDYSTPDTGNPRKYGNGAGIPKLMRREGFADSGGASRFFYCAKADTAERNAGLGSDRSLWGSTEAPDGNDHPTVKPIDLMRWLVLLVAPPGGMVLDPFAGSGSTGIAAVLEGFDFCGIEREAGYVSVARARIAHWANGELEAA